jgi:hypothetical protein
MNATPRLAAAFAAVAVTLSLFHGVASLAAPSERVSARLAALTSGRPAATGVAGKATERAGDDGELARSPAGITQVATLDAGVR